MNKLIQAGGACLMLALPASVAASAETNNTQSAGETVTIETTTVEATNAKSDSASQAETAELSVPPLDHVDYPMSRPQWCDQEPDFTKQDHQIVVATGPCDSFDQCEEELRWMTRAAVVTYAKGLLDSTSEFESRVDFSAFSDSAFSDQDIDDHLVSRRYEGSVTVGGETKFEKVVQLEFTPEIQSEIRDASKVGEVERRLVVLAFMGLLGTVLLACSSGLLGLASRRVAKRETSAGELA